MAELLVQHLECVQRLLERLEGPEREQTASLQATAFAAMLAKLQTLPSGDAALVKAAIGDSCFTDEAKRMFLVRQCDAHAAKLAVGILKQDGHRGLE